MLKHELSERLNTASLTQPFSELGLIAAEDGKGLWLRVWMPDALSVEVFDSKNQKNLGQLQQLEQTGLFAIKFARRKHQFDYQLKVTYADKVELCYDPYQFKSQAFHAVHYLQTEPENIYQQLGAQLIDVKIAKQSLRATRFAVFAPNANSCSLIGDFNGWDGRKLPMEKTHCGHFVLVVPQCLTGAKYKFEIKDSQGQTLTHKSDPIGFYQEQYPSFASIVYDHNQYQWQDQAWQNSKQEDFLTQPMSIYEVHLGSWRMKTEGEQQVPLTYPELIDQLIPYVVEMGYSHIELLPISEHPFTGSWGYQPTAMFAPTSRFGNPDQFKAFVDACHTAGLGVIMDWVPAHFPEDGHGLAKFDGSYVYEYEDPRKGWHPDWHSCIYDFGKDTVRQFLVASALYWLDKFHIDGLRVDAVASMLYLDYSREQGQWLPNVDGGNHNYEAISLLQWMNRAVAAKFPKALTIAEESTSFAGVSKPVEDGGLGFSFKWNMGWMHDSLTYINKDPSYRKYHHNDMTFAMVYNYDEHFVLPISHDEVVHGKGSLYGKMPGDEWQQAANVRAFAGFMYAHPGKKLNFMGSELGQVEEWNHNKGLAWHNLIYPKHQGIQTLFKDLNRLYRSEAPLHQLDHQHQGFQWLDHEDSERSILAFSRLDNMGNEILVVSNFTPLPRDGYRLGVNQLGEYQLIFNSDSEFYWGSNYSSGARFVASAHPCMGKAQSIEFNLPPLATVYIKHKSE